MSAMGSEDADEAAEAGRKSTMIEHPNPIHKPFVQFGAARVEMKERSTRSSTDRAVPALGFRPRLELPPVKKEVRPRAAHARALPRNGCPRVVPRRARHTPTPPHAAPAARQEC